MSSIPSEYLAEVLENYEKYIQMGESALRQVSDEDLHRRLDEEANSIAMIVRHLRGNLISRWTDFLTTDGEKPDRDRDSEFEPRSASRHEVEHWWVEGFTVATEAIESLRPTDLTRVVTIRGEPMSVLQAIQRNLLHTAYHVGQMVLLAKHFRGSDWETLSIPRAK